MFDRAVHPGEILKGELADLGMSSAELARRINVPANAMSRIVDGKRSITGDTALRLGHWFGNEPEFWLNLQTQFDLCVAGKAETIGRMKSLGNEMIGKRLTNKEATR